MQRTRSPRLGLPTHSLSLTIYDSLDAIIKVFGHGDVDPKLRQIAEDLGAWGFSEGVGSIHLWASPIVRDEEIIETIAHELGHLRRPYFENFEKEELKADGYGKVARLAYAILGIMRDGI